MPLYLVIKPEDEGPLSNDSVKDCAEIASSVGVSSEKDNNIWVVRTSLETCGKVADVLGIGDGDAGLVFKITTESDGFYYNRFWDSLKTMEEADRK